MSDLQQSGPVLSMALVRLQEHWGSERTWISFVAVWNDAIRSLVYAQLGRQDLIDEAVQEVWLVLHRAVLEFVADGEARARSWLRHIVRHAVWRVVKREQRWTQARALPVDLSCQVDPAEALSRQETTRAVRRFIAAADSEHREALAALLTTGDTLSGQAQAQGCSRRHLRRRRDALLARGRKELAAHA